jgi:uncharacterized protein
VQPAEWLLFLLALRDAEEPLDPVRLQKGMFLLAEEGGLSKDEAYAFRPYDYGPFSSDIYRDLHELVRQGWVRDVPVRGYNWSSYAITDEGLEHAAARVAELDTKHREILRHLAAVKKEVLGLKFDALLRRVYDRHPEYAENSVFRYRPNRVF